VSSNHSFHLFLADIRAGNNDGARQLYERHFANLVRHATCKISKRHQVRTDPEDVAQSCLKSFFVRAADGQFDLENWGDVWSTLLGILGNKSNNAMRFHSRQKRNAARDESGDETDWQLADNEPSPDEHAEFQEIVENLLNRFESDDRSVIELSLLGLTPTEIADKLQRARRGVFRVRAEAKAYLEALRASD
jgi:RNA polymerase sigma factor (sigma-70 family)